MSLARINALSFPFDTAGTEATDLDIAMLQGALVNYEAACDRLVKRFLFSKEIDVSRVFDIIFAFNKEESQVAKDLGLADQYLAFAGNIKKQAIWRIEREDKAGELEHMKQLAQEMTGADSVEIYTLTLESDDEFEVLKAFELLPFTTMSIHKDGLSQKVIEERTLFEFKHLFYEVIFEFEKLTSPSKRTSH
jgi:hypothetical protein